MKKIITVMICLFLAGSSFAQDKKITYGVKAGLNLSSVLGKISGYKKINPGFHVGVVTEYFFAPKFALAPELLFSLQGGGNKISNVKFKFGTYNLQIPIMVKYEVIENLSVELGPQLGFVLGHKFKSNGENQESLMKLNVFDLALGAGATYNYQNFFGTLRYTYSLTDLAKNVKSHYSVIQIGVGYRF